MYWFDITYIEHFSKQILFRIKLVGKSTLVMMDNAIFKNW